MQCFHTAAFAPSPSVRFFFSVFFLPPFSCFLYFKCYTLFVCSRPCPLHFYSKGPLTGGKIVVACAIVRFGSPLITHTSISCTTFFLRLMFLRPTLFNLLLIRLTLPVFTSFSCLRRWYLVVLGQVRLPLKYRRRWHAHYAVCLCGFRGGASRILRRR